jgi:hypothetical protein
VSDENRLKSSLLGGGQEAEMQHRLRIVEGYPWREAIACVLDPRASFRPWHGIDRVVPGDQVIVTIHTEPRTVLCAFTFDADSDVASVGRKRARFGTTLRMLSDVEHQAGYSLRESADLTVDSRAATALLGVVGEKVYSVPAERVGTSSAVAARILLHNGRRCVACGQPIDLDPSSDDLCIHLVSEEDFRSNRDWPAALCRKCTAAMDAQSTSSLVDYMFSGLPSCPGCSRARTRRVIYGRMGYFATMNRRPWESHAGCVVDEAAVWLCSTCGFTWGSPDEQDLT